ncbi:MAG TPA: hypothetical protein PLU53_08045 [Bacteroidia bacterium]|nr:hypothetical protein [Bacteroidia bacterium]
MPTHGVFVASQIYKHTFPSHIGSTYYLPATLVFPDTLERVSDSLFFSAFFCPGLRTVTRQPPHNPVAATCSLQSFTTSSFRYIPLRSMSLHSSFVHSLSSQVAATAQQECSFIRFTYFLIGTHSFTPLLFPPAPDTDHENCLMVSSSQLP